MPKVKLTKTVVENAPTPAAPDILWDTALPGFGLALSPSGVKTFVVQYRPRDSRTTKRVSLGRYAFESYELSQAKKQAQEMLGGVKLGRDPVAERKQAQAAKTVSELMAVFLEKHVAVKNKPLTAKIERALIERTITGRQSTEPKKRIAEKPFGKLRLHELTSGRVSAWHEGIGSKVSANRALAHLSRACRLAIKEGWLVANPCPSVDRNQEKPKDRAFSDDELARIGMALRDLEADSKILPTVALGIRLLAVTGLRPGEIRLAKWEDYQPTMKRLRLPNSKTGKRSVRLSAPAMSLLDTAIRNSPWIMTGHDPEKPVSDTRFAQMVQAVLVKAKVAGATPHVFRHTFATFAAENGATDSELMAIGGWNTRAMVTRYVKLADVDGENRHPLSAPARVTLAMNGKPDNLVQLGQAA